MPTRGLLTKDVTQVEVFPLTFGELLKYLGDEQLTPAREYIRAFKFMISKDENIAKISLLDADYLSYVFGALSASKDAKITAACECKHCHKIHRQGVKLNEIQFNDITNEAMSIRQITLGGQDILFRYPTIKDFIDFVGSLGRFAENIKIDTLKLACMLDTNVNKAINAINNSVQEDIALINYLDSILFNLIKPVEILCPDHLDLRGTTATFSMSAVNIFRDIVQYNTITDDQILFREIRKSSESE